MRRLLLSCLLLFPIAAHAAPPLSVTSPVLRDGRVMPKAFTCDGDDASPPLTWSGAPALTRSYAVTMDDPNAPPTPTGDVFNHWVAFDIPPVVRSLDQGLPKTGSVNGRMTQGVNSTGGVGYHGACPPSGFHRYVFTVYALNVVPNLPQTATRADLMRAMQGHILASGSLTPTYARSGP